MNYDSITNQTTRTLRRRHSIRLKGYDYAQAGAYFITLVTYQRACLFGHIVEGEMELDEIGRIVEEQWLHTAEVRPNIELDDFVIMPNHFHGIIVIVDDIDPGAAVAVGASRRLAHDVTRVVDGPVEVGHAHDVTRGVDRPVGASRWLAHSHQAKGSQREALLV